MSYNNLKLYIMIINKIFKVFVVLFLVWFGATIVRGMVQYDVVSVNHKECCHIVITKINDTETSFLYVDNIREEEPEEIIYPDIMIAKVVNNTIDWCRDNH